jgi:hypothetical protein
VKFAPSPSTFTSLKTRPYIVCQSSKLIAHAYCAYCSMAVTTSRSTNAMACRNSLLSLAHLISGGTVRIADMTSARDILPTNGGPDGNYLVLRPEVASS